MTSKFTISKYDIIEAQLYLNDKLISDLFTNGFKSIEEICMRLRLQIHDTKKGKGILIYNINNVTKGLTKTIKREVRNTSLMI